MSINIKRIFFTLTVLTVAFLYSCQSQLKETGFTLNGQIKNIPANTSIYLEEITYNSAHGIDSSRTDATGNFSMQGFLKNEGLYQLRMNSDKAILLVLDEKPASIEIIADSSDFTAFKYKITGSPASEQLRTFIVKTKEFGEQFSQAMQDYRSHVTDQTPDSVRKTYEEKVKAADAAFRSFDANYIDTVKSPVIAIFAAYNLNYERDRPVFDTLEQKIRNDYASLPFAQAFLKQLEDQRAPAQQSQDGAKFGIGEIAPDIQLNDVNGKQLKLSSLKGNYVLVDFWASWCGPCRRENPNVVSAYQQYKNKGFTIYSVSLDTDKDKWLKAIKADGLIWPNHVSELQGWNSAICQVYGVQSIPQNYLLDKEGRIIASNLRGEDLASTLQKLIQ